jgi:hypothetical protein
MGNNNFFRDCGKNPLVQGNAVLFRESLGRFLDGMRKLQWICSPTYRYILLKIIGYFNWRNESYRTGA